MDYLIRPCKRSELDLMIDWAAKEGWNPGRYDGDAFYSVDPLGFYMGFLDGEPISSISVVSYNKNFGFVGFYIVRPEFRGKDYGYKLWQEAIKHLPTQNIGLDGVVSQQNNYKKSGFELAHKNIRYETVGTLIEITDPNFVNLSEVSFDLLNEYDAQMFPCPRPTFLKEWINQPKSLALAYYKSGQIMGYGVIRSCTSGFKIGPLFADTPEIADRLFRKFKHFAGEGSEVYLDIPEINPEALKLAETYQMKPVFETARMYTKGKPKVDLQRVFGITTFELG